MVKYLKKNPRELPEPTVHRDSNFIVTLKFQGIRDARNMWDYEMDFSLQRHHYYFLNENASSATVNSIVHKSVPEGEILAEVKNMGKAIQTSQLGQLMSGASEFPFMGDHTSGARTYRVDSATHFYVVGGTQVSANLTGQQWTALRSFRITEHLSSDEVINYNRLRQTDRAMVLAARDEIRRAGGLPFLDIIQAISENTNLVAAYRGII